MKRQAAKPKRDQDADDSDPAPRSAVDREQELAATKIQSRVRGKQARCGASIRAIHVAFKLCNAFRSGMRQTSRVKEGSPKCDTFCPVGVRLNSADKQHQSGKRRKMRTLELRTNLERGMLL